jgi:hypothetical protein
MRDDVAKASSQSSPPPPVLRVTPYEQVSSGLLAVIAALVTIVAILTFSWYATRQPRQIAAVPVELVEFPGGVEDGSPDETLRVDSPAPEAYDATGAEVDSPRSQAEISLDNVAEIADDAVAQTDQQFELGTRAAGKVGSASGTGRRALGSGPGLRGFPREQRWYIRFSDQQDLDEYARQLDFFGIEFGAIVGGKMMYVSKFAAPQPVVRTATSGKGETRLYMTWQGGGRKQADLQLFRKAAIEVGNGALFQFYPKAAENRLAILERDYKKRKAEEIRRTYFAVKRVEAGYDFEVIRQTYLK